MTSCIATASPHAHSTDGPNVTGSVPPQASLLSPGFTAVPISTSPVTPVFGAGGRKVPISPHRGRSRGNSFLTASGSEEGSRSPQDQPQVDDDQELTAVTPLSGSSFSAPPVENGNLASLAFFGPKSPSCRKSPNQRHLEVDAAVVRRRQKANSLVGSTNGVRQVKGSEEDLCIVVPPHPHPHPRPPSPERNHHTLVKIVPPSVHAEGRTEKELGDGERFLAPIYRCLAKEFRPTHEGVQPFTPVVAPPLHFTEVGDLLGLISTWLGKEELKQARRVCRTWKEHMDPCFIHRVISRRKKNSLEFDIEEIRHNLSEQRRWSVKLILAITLALILCCGTIAFSLMATGIFSIAIVIFFSIIMFGFRFLYSYWGLTVYPKDPTFMVLAEQLKNAPVAYLSASRLATRNKKKTKTRTPLCDCEWFKGGRRLSVWRMTDALFFLFVAALSFYAITLGLEHAYEYLWTDDPVYPAECILTYDEQIDSDGPSYLTFTDPYRWQVVPQLGLVQHSFSGDSVVDYFIVAQYLGDFFEPGVVKDGYLSNTTQGDGAQPDLTVPEPVPSSSSAEVIETLDQVRRLCKWYSPMHTMNWTAPLRRDTKPELLQSDRWWSQITLNRPMIALQVNSRVARPDISTTNMTQLVDWFWTLITKTEGQPLQATLALQKQDVLEEYLTWKFNCPMFCHGIPLLNGVVGVVDTSEYLRDTLIALSFVGAAIIVGGFGRLIWFQYAVVRPTRAELRRLQTLGTRLAEAQIYLSQFRGDADGLDSSRSPSTSLGSPTPTSPSSTKAFPLSSGRSTAVVGGQGKFSQEQASPSPESAGHTSTSMPTPSPGIGSTMMLGGRIAQHPAESHVEPSSPFESSSPMPSNTDRSQSQHQSFTTSVPFGGPSSPHGSIPIPRATSVDGPAFEFIPTRDDSPSPFQVELEELPHLGSLATGQRTGSE